MPRSKHYSHATCGFCHTTFNVEGKNEKDAHQKWYNRLYIIHLEQECPSFPYGDKAQEALELRRQIALDQANGDPALIALYNEQFAAQSAGIHELLHGWKAQYLEYLTTRVDINTETSGRHKER